MDVYKVLRGIMGNLFHLGGPDGPNLKNSSGAIEARNAGDSAYARVRALNIAVGSGLSDVPTLLDLQGRVPNVEYSFDGASPPAGGANTGKFGICHTSGGSYNQGDVVYDNGAALVKIPTEVVRTITTGSAVTGDLSLIANGLYAYQGGTWILKGDGTPDLSGHDMTIGIAIGTDASYSSTTAVPAGAIVKRTVVIVDTPYDNGTTATVIVDGTSDETLMAAGDSKMDKANQYESDEVHAITASTEGVITVNITNTPAAGAGRVYVTWSLPSS